MKLIAYYNRKRASALVAVVIFGAIMSLCAAFAYRSTLFQRKMAERSQNYLAALAVAEAGAELAMVELNRDPKSETKAFASWTGTTTKTYTEDVEDADGNTIGETVVEVTDLDAEPKIVATGYIPSKADAQLRRTVQLSTKNNTVPSPFGGFGLFAYENIYLNGTTQVYSYNSVTDAGNYLGVKGDNAAVGAVGNVDYKNNGMVHGTVQASSTNKKAKATKGINHTTPTLPPALPSPEFNTTPPDSNDNGSIIFPDIQNALTGSSLKTFGSEDITFPAGEYVLSSVDLNGSGDMVVSGPGETTIYVSGEFKMNGNSNVVLLNGATLNIKANTFSMNGPSGGGNSGGGNNGGGNKGGGNNGGGNNDDSDSGEAPMHFTGDGTVNVVANNVDFGRSLIMAGQTPVTFHVENAIVFNGERKFNLDNGAPAQNLKIFAKNAVTFNGGVNMAACFYMPNADLRINGGGGGPDSFIRGVFVAKNIDYNGNQAIYLEEDATWPTGGSGTYVTAWHERAPVDL